MVDYQKMYAILCGAIDDVLDELYHIPLAAPSAAVLQKALSDTEELYINAEEPLPPICPEAADGETARK